MYYIIAAIMVAAIALAVVWVVAKRRIRDAHNRKLVQPFVEWAQAVLLADTDEQKVALLEPEFTTYHHTMPVFPKIYRDAQAEQRYARNRIGEMKRLADVRRRYDEAQTIKFVPKRLEAYLAIIGDCKRDAESTDIVATVASETRDHTDELLRMARAGRRDAFLKLAALVCGLRRYSDTPYSKLVGEWYEFPHDWDDMVVRYFKSPTLSDFKANYAVSHPGALRFLAVQALHKQSLKTAKVVLAHYDVEDSRGDKWRREVGEILMAELAKMVYHIHVDQHMVFV